MKKWNAPEIAEMDVKETACYDPWWFFYIPNCGKKHKKDNDDNTTTTLEEDSGETITENGFSGQ